MRLDSRPFGALLTSNDKPGSPKRHALPMALIRNLVIGATVACANTDRNPTQQSIGAQVRSANSAPSDATFSFSADVTINATTKEWRDAIGRSHEQEPPSGQSGATRVVTQYHVEYTEFGERVVMEITPPTQYASDPAHASRAARPIPWATLRRIRIDSDSQFGEFTLWSGRTIVGDYKVLTSLSPRAGTPPEVTSRTALERARLVRSRIRPLLRLRAGSSLKGLGFDTTTANVRDSDLATWVQLSSDFDVVVTRMLSPRVENTGRRPSLSIEVGNARVVGTPSALE